MATVSQVWTNNYQYLLRWRKRLHFEFSLSRFLQLRFNLVLFSFLPLFLIKRYMAAMSWLYFFVRWGQVSTIRRNLALALRDRTPSEVAQISRGVIKGIVRHYQEKIYNGFYETPDLRDFLISRVSLNGASQVLQEAMREGRGVIIASAHYGALEFLPRYLAVRQYPTVTMVKFKTERLKEILVRRADEDGLGLIIPGNGTNVMNEASKAIHQNKILVTQCDETDEWRVDRSVTMDFLGQKIHPDRMLSVLCKRTGAVLLFGVMHRTGKEKYELRLHRVPDEGDEPISVRTLKLLEQYIYRNPEQWYEWKKYHKFASSN